MAFTSTIELQTIFGDKKIVIGTWDGTSVTTGELDLSPFFSGKIYYVGLTLATAAGGTLTPTIDETWPVDSGTVLTLVFNSGDDGIFFAIGDAD